MRKKFMRNLFLCLLLLLAMSSICAAGRTLNGYPEATRIEDVLNGTAPSSGQGFHSASNPVSKEKDVELELTTNDLTIAENGKATLKIGLKNDSQHYVWLKKVEFTVDVKNMNEGILFTLKQKKNLVHKDILGGNLWGALPSDGKKIAPGQEIFMDIKFKDSAIFVPQGHYQWSTSIQYKYSLNPS